MQSRPFFYILPAYHSSSRCLSVVVCHFQAICLSDCYLCCASAKEFHQSTYLFSSVHFITPICCNVLIVKFAFCPIHEAESFTSYKLLFSPALFANSCGSCKSLFSMGISLSSVLYSHHTSGIRIQTCCLSGGLNDFRYSVFCMILKLGFEPG